MSGFRASWVECDSCHESTPSDVGCRTMADARSFARADGWAISTRRAGLTNNEGGSSIDLCFDCRTLDHADPDAGEHSDG